MDVGVFTHTCHPPHPDWDATGALELHKAAHIVPIVGRSSGRERGALLEIRDLYAAGACQL